MKICKVKPDHATCSACVETQQMFDVVDDCSKCKLNTEIYELLQIDLAYRYPKTKEKRVSVLRLDTECLCGNLEGTPSLSSILTGRLPGNTYLIREGIIENRPYKT